MGHVASALISLVLPRHFRPQSFKHDEQSDSLAQAPPYRPYAVRSPVARGADGGRVVRQRVGRRATTASPDSSTNSPSPGGTVPTPNSSSGLPGRGSSSSTTVGSLRSQASDGMTFWKSSTTATPVAAPSSPAGPRRPLARCRRRPHLRRRHPRPAPQQCPPHHPQRRFDETALRLDEVRLQPLYFNPQPPPPAPLWTSAPPR